MESAAFDGVAHKRDIIMDGTLRYEDIFGNKNSTKYRWRIMEADDRPFIYDFEVLSEEVIAQTKTQE